MAIVKGPIKMTGSISGLSFYTRRGSDEIIVRTKGGVSGDKIKRLPQYEGLRKQQKEWSGTTKMGSGVRSALGGLHRLADYNISPTINSIASKMQKANQTDEKGKRPVCLSKYKHSLIGFNLNRQFLFNSVLRSQLSFDIDREKLTAFVQFSAINTDFDLMNVQRLPYFRLIVSLGTVSDMIFKAELDDYTPSTPNLHGIAINQSTDWFPTTGRVEPTELNLQMNDSDCIQLTDEVSVILSVAIEFANIGIDNQPIAVKYAGSCKVLDVK